MQPKFQVGQYVRIDNTALGGSIIGPYPIVEVIDKLNIRNPSEYDVPLYILQMPPDRVVKKPWRKPVTEAYLLPAEDPHVSV